MSEYPVLDLDKVKEKLQQVKAGTATAGWTFWRCPEGKSIIRVLPRSDGTFWYESYEHIGVGGRTFACPRRMKDQPCIVCDAASALFSSNDQKSVVLARDLKAKVRYYYNIVDLQDPSIGVQIFASGVRIFEELLSFASDPDWGDFTNLEQGYNVIIERKGTGIDTEYKVRLQKNSTAIDASFMEHCTDLETLTQYFSDSDMRQCLSLAASGRGVELSTRFLPKVDTQHLEGVDRPSCLGKEFGATDKCTNCQFVKECVQLTSEKGK